MRTSAYILDLVVVKLIPIDATKKKNQNNTIHKYNNKHIYKTWCIVCISQQIFEQFFNFGSDLLFVLFYFKYCQIFLITFLVFGLKTGDKI